MTQCWYNDPCICEEFITDLSHPSTKFNNKDPCKTCGHRLKDHPEFQEDKAK